MNVERLLRDGAERAVPEALDHRVRTALRTMPMPAGKFASPTLALGIALGATLALTVGLAMSLASAGAAESGVATATLWVVGYLGVATVVSLPLLARLGAGRRNREVQA